MTGRGHEWDFWGISIVLFLDLGAHVTHFMKIYKAVHVHVHLPVDLLYLSEYYVLPNKESLTPTPALVWSLKHMFLIPLEGLVCSCPTSKRTSGTKAAESSFGWEQRVLAGETCARQGLPLTPRVLPHFWLPALSADTWLHSHFNTSLLGMLEQ